jgi:hypothetical protein
MASAVAGSTATEMATIATKILRIKNSTHCSLYRSTANFTTDLFGFVALLNGHNPGGPVAEVLRVTMGLNERLARNRFTVLLLSLRNCEQRV